MAYHPEYHGIRLDVYADDENHTRFNIEMQMVYQKYLPKRSRYYHSHLDMDALASGESYEELPDTYVIFICDFDPFGKSLYRYTCETRCVEDNFEVKDGRKTIYLNTRGTNKEDVPDDLVEFLRYVRATQEESEEEFQDSFVKNLQEKVRKIKNDRAMEERYMLLEEMLRNEHKEGHGEGLREAKAESVLTLLEMKGSVSDALAERIKCEEDMSKLSKWLILSAQCSSIEEFEQRM